MDAISGWESPWSRDTRAPWGIHDKDPAPYNRLYGPVHARGGVAGVVLHRGDLLAQWGDVHRSDLTFSVAKTYLALLAGLAHGDGLLPDVHEPVVRRCPGIGFEGEGARVIATDVNEATLADLHEALGDREAVAIGLQRTGKVALRDEDVADPLIRYREIALP